MKISTGLYKRVGPLLAFVAAAFTFGTFASGTVAATSPFVAIDLGTLGGVESEATAVNASGQVVGWSITAQGAEHAFSWTGQGGMADLGSLGGTAWANAVNDRGQVVGDSFTADGHLDAFSWTPQDGMIDIPDPFGDQNHALTVNNAGQVLLGPGGGGGSLWTKGGGTVTIVNPSGGSFWPAAMNDKGQVVGFGYLTPESYYQAFSWTEEGGMVVIGPANAYSVAVGVTDNGQVVGWVGSATTGVRSSFSWTYQGGWIDLPLGGAEAVNEASQVVGWVEGRGLVSWTPTGGLVDLATLGGDKSRLVASNSYGDYRSLTEGGQVVGASTVPSGDEHAFSWTQQGGMIDLGTLGGVSSEAVAVNEAGQIVGTSKTASGKRHATLWEEAAQSWYVSPTGSDSNSCANPGDACATINGALTNPGFVPGDTVYVAAGTFADVHAVGQIVLLDKDARLSGGWNATFTSQSGMTVINAAVTPGWPYHRGVTVNGGVSASMDSFVIENGEAPDFPGGGGILNNGELVLTNSAVTHGSSAAGIAGGGIFNAGTLVVEDSSVTDNQGIEGAGIATGGTLFLRDVSVARNSGRGGGGLYVLGGGTARIENSTIDDNSAFTPGAGIYSEGEVVLTNSTVSGNAAASPWEGGGVYSGGNGSLTANNSTITNNSAGTGGGIYGGGIKLRNSIVAGNTAIYSPDCAAQVQSAGYNLIGNASGCTFAASTGDLLNRNARLGPLADNGGPTLTHALSPQSAAIDAGNSSGCVDDTGALLVTDQRGLPRPLGTACDIGAFEAEPPPPPSPSVPDLASTSDSGLSDSDNVTNKTSLAFVGTAEPGAVVTLYRGEAVAGTTTADATTGAWSIRDIVVAEGSYAYTATATDAGGHVSAHSTALQVTVDRVGTAPSTPDLAAAGDSGVSGTDNITNKTSLTFTGTAEPGSTVTLYRGPSAVATGTADASVGTWSLTDASAPPEFSHEYQATATDLAGNVSPSATVLVVTVDTIAPALDIIGAPDGKSFTLPQLPPRPTFSPSDMGSGIATSHDSWTTPGTPDGSGTYVYTATATDVAGNESNQTRSYTAVDRTPPAPPSLGVSDSVTNKTSPTFTGVAEAGSTVTLLRGSTTVATATAGAAGGAWSLTDSGLADGSYAYTATATDAAGNVSAASSALSVTVDTVAPMLNVVGGADGTSYTPPNLPLRPTFAPTDSGSGIANKADGWTTPSGGGAGTYTYTATANDWAGNSSTQTLSYVVTAPPASSGGGGGGGGGGSSTIAVVISPKAQSIASGAAAQFTVVVTNTGGGYLYSAGVVDGLAPSCNRTSGQIADLWMFAPGLSVSYSCSAAGVTASFTNVVVATATTGAAEKVTASDSAEVTVLAQFTSPATTPPVVKTPQGVKTPQAVVVRPVIGKPTTVPTRLVAGKNVAIRFKVTRSDTGARLTAGRMICDPSLYGKLINHRERFTNGTATLRFTIPKTAKGKLLKVGLTIKLGGQSATRLSSFRVS